MTQTSKAIGGKPPGSSEPMLKDDELVAVSGGTMLERALSDVLKSLGDGLSTMARKG